MGDILTSDRTITLQTSVYNTHTQGRAGGACEAAVRYYESRKPSQQVSWYSLLSVPNNFLMFQEFPAFMYPKSLLPSSQKQTTRP
jgi:hypothetical protein